MYEPKRFRPSIFAIISIVVLAGIGILFFTSQLLTPQPDFEPEASGITQIAPTATLPPIATPRPTNTPTLIPTVTIVPILRFGMVASDSACSAFNTVVMSVLGDLEIRTELRIFDEADSLYQALADRNVDLTICFRDPIDRPFLTKHVGFLKTIDAPYLDNGEIRRQVILNAANIVPLHEERPCLVQFLQAIPFEAETESAETWLAENQSVINTWIDCN